MISETPVHVTQRAEPAFDDHLDHWVCCEDPDLAFCGKDMTGRPWSDFDEADCVVCADLWDAERCPRDGSYCPTDNDETLLIWDECL